MFPLGYEPVFKQEKSMWYSNFEDYHNFEGIHSELIPKRLSSKEIIDLLQSKNKLIKLI